MPTAAPTGAKMGVTITSAGAVSMGKLYRFLPSHREDRGGRNESPYLQRFPILKSGLKKG